MTRRFQHVCVFLTELNYRDDLTVEVIFFGEGGQPGVGGQVSINEEATARSKDEVKAKL